MVNFYDKLERNTMAKKTETPSTITRELPKGAKRFSRTGDGLSKFVEGEEIRGIFMSMAEKTITDRRSGELKSIRIYSIKLPDTSIARIGSRRLLDDAFDEVVTELKGEENLRGRDVSFIRGEDVETADHNPMGTYEIIVWN
jgi:hypothetical protein